MLRSLLRQIMVIVGIGGYAGIAEGGSIILGHKASAQALEREAARDLQVYRHLLTERSHDPERFDRRQPLLGQVLSDPSSFEYWLNRWQANPARFEHWHPRFWRVLHGEALASVPVAPPPPLNPPAGQNPDPPTPPNPVGPGGDPSPPGSVPEPGSCILLVTGLGIFLVVQRGYRFRRR
jgi:hypothetical protein